MNRSSILGIVQDIAMASGGQLVSVRPEDLRFHGMDFLQMEIFFKKMQNAATHRHQ